MRARGRIEGSARVAGGVEQVLRRRSRIEALRPRQREPGFPDDRGELHGLERGRGRHERLGRDDHVLPRCRLRPHARHAVQPLVDGMVHSAALRVRELREPIRPRAGPLDALRWTEREARQHEEVVAEERLRGGDAEVALRVPRPNRRAAASRSRSRTAGRDRRAARPADPPCPARRRSPAPGRPAGADPPDRGRSCASPSSPSGSRAPRS